MNGKLLYYYKHTLIMMKNHAGPNDNLLPLRLFFDSIKTDN